MPVALLAAFGRCAPPASPKRRARRRARRGGRPSKYVGVWFRRQVPLGRYIADFAAPAARLVVEVDGGYHARRASADGRRDRKLARMGYRVLRLDAEVIEQKLYEAVARVRAALAR